MYVHVYNCIYIACIVHVCTCTCMYNNFNYYCVLNIIIIAMGNPSFGVPERLKLEVAIANEALEAERWVWSLCCHGYHLGII